MESKTEVKESDNSKNNKETYEIFIGGGTELETTEKNKKRVKPNVTALRNWDANLLRKFKPKYYSAIPQCQYCTFGPCDLSKNRMGACGMRLNIQMAREALVTVIVGASSYSARAMELNDALIKEREYFAELNLSEYQTTLINLLCGYEPKTIGDLKKALKYINEQIVHLISATHMGQEASDFDLNSKAFHGGMMCLLAMEIYEILRKFSKIKEDVVEIVSNINKNKGVVLVVGKTYKIEIKGDFEIISNSFDGAINIGGKIVEDLALDAVLKITDVVVLGEGNVNVDLPEKAKNFGIPVIATSNRNLSGFADLSNISADEIFKNLMSKEISGCFIKDRKKLSDVVSMIAGTKKRASDANPLRVDSEQPSNETVLIAIGNVDANSLKMDPILLVLGDANFPNGRKEIEEILHVFLNKNFHIFTAGDVAVSIAKNLNHKNLVNLGSTSACITVIEKMIKMACKNLKTPCVGNFEEVADYISSKIPIAAIFCGAFSQENFAIANGLMRVGIPVIFGPQGTKYRREFRSDVVIDYSKDDYNEILKNGMGDNKIFLFPHLYIAAKTKEEYISLIQKSVLRNSEENGEC